MVSEPCCFFELVSLLGSPPIKMDTCRQICACVCKHDYAWGFIAGVTTQRPGQEFCTPGPPPQALSSSRPPRGTQIMHRLLQWPQGPHPPHWASVMLCTQDGGLSQEPEGQGVVKPGRDRGRGWGRDVPAPEAWLGGSRSTPALEPADGAWHGPPDGSVVSFCKQNFRDPNHMGYFLHLSVCVAMHEFPTPDKAATWRGVFAEGKSPGGWGKTSCTKVGVGVINKEPTS